MKVIDGDTIKVDIGGRVRTVRLIGVDTPETVDPRKPVEYFGEEASAFTEQLSGGQGVRLQTDPKVSDEDRYGRLLRYVFLADGRLLNSVIIARGYGHAYTRFGFSRMGEFRRLESEARQGKLGLWADTGYESTNLARNLEEELDGNLIVYITKTGKKYHREGCPHLSRSSIATTLKYAAKRYRPCSSCSPPVMPR
ncbi:MAG: thermonuclease family protein [Acidobacteriota bacterium]